MSAVLEIKGLTVTTNQDVPLVNTVDFILDAGSVHGLVGESGAGKSTIAKAILGILPPSLKITSGEILFKGDDLLQMSPREKRQLLGRDITLIPQDPLSALNPSRKIGRQLTDGLVHKAGMSQQAATAFGKDLLESVQIRDIDRVMKSYPHELSGGMRQRILIASAFALKPKLIIADEPTTALDVTVQKQILKLLRGLQREFGASVIFVTHDLGIVAKVCDQVTVLLKGEIVEQNSVEALFENPAHTYTRALLDAMPRYDKPGLLQDIEYGEAAQ